MDHKKIIENTITALVTGVFIGDCVIVWNGATTVQREGY